MLHESELRADLQQFYGVDFDKARRGDYSVAHIAALASQLPQESRCALLGNKDSAWGLTDVLLAILINRFSLFVWGMAPKKSRGKKPEMIGPSYLTNQKRSLQARVMPIKKLMEELSKPRKGVNGG